MCLIEKVKTDMNTDENLWSVYKHTSPSGKVYIGIAKDIKHRWRANGNGYKGSTRFHNAIIKYGWDAFQHEILYSNLSREDACKLEIELINKYNSTDIRYGYNLESGGNSPTVSEETRQKLREINIGHPVSREVREKMSEIKSKKVVCVETGEVFKSVKDAAEKLKICRSSVGRCANGKASTANGYHFRFLEDIENGVVKEFNFNPPKYKKVLCLTTNEVYETVCDASRKTGLSRRSISYACNGKHKTCGGMEWKFTN